MVSQENTPPADSPAPPLPEADQLNYFAEREQAFQLRFRGARDRLLDPLVRRCLAVGITAEVVSAIAFLMLVPFGAQLFVDGGQWPLLAASACLLLHVGLDGLDGPLARRAGTDGRAGAFTDMCLDHAGFLTVAVLLAASGRLNGVVAAAYVATYTLSVVFTILLNLLHRPLRFVVRTKYLFYALFILHALGAPNWLTPSAALFAAVHAVFCVIGYFAVRAALAATERR
jgi:phosphatidylglycerophosphate synthase